MTVNDIREQIANMDQSELQDQYDLYMNMQARGVRDEIRLTLLEQELYDRTMFAE